MRHGHVWLAAAGAAWLLALPRGASAQAPSQLAPEFTNQATKALVEGKFEEALVKADAALKADPHAPWAHYARAEALVSLKRHDEAVPSYEAAESKLPEPDIRGRALAVWGRASSLRQDGRCEDAKKAFADYGAMMKPIDAQAAEQAQPFVGACQSAGGDRCKDPDRASPACGRGHPRCPASAGRRRATPASDRTHPRRPRGKSTRERANQAGCPVVPAGRRANQARRRADQARRRANQARRRADQARRRAGSCGPGTRS